MKILGVIPARAGSKGIPNKNVTPLAGKPLLAYIVEAAKGARALDRVILSTDSREIAELAKGLGLGVPFIRPAEFAADHISVTAVSKHAMEFYDAMNIRFDAIMSLQVTSPFTSPNDIDCAVNKMLEVNCDSVVSMKMLQEVHPWRIYNMVEDRVLPFNEYTNENFPQRQDRPIAYKFSGAIYLRKRRLLEDWNGVDFALGSDVRGILIPPERAIDINTPIDLVVAEAMIK